MSDPSAQLLPALKAALQADAAFIAAMGGKAKVYDIGPTNAAKPYAILGGATTTPVLGDCVDAAETDLTLDIWSLTPAPSQAEAMAIAAAGQAVMLTPPALADFTVLAAVPVRVEHLVDLSDGKTAHSVVVVRYATAPK